MKLLPYLLSATLLIASCQSGDQTDGPVTSTDTTEVKPPVKTYPPEAGCAFSMSQLKAAEDGKSMAVSGIKHCDDGRVFQEVTLYAKGEAINNKKANVYSIPDTLNPVSISWSGDTLVVTHHNPAETPTLQEFSVEGVPVVYAVESVEM